MHRLRETTYGLYKMQSPKDLFICILKEFQKTKYTRLVSIPVGKTKTEEIEYQNQEILGMIRDKVISKAGHTLKTTSPSNL